MKEVSLRQLKKRRSGGVVVFAVAVLLLLFAPHLSSSTPKEPLPAVDVLAAQAEETGLLAREVLETLEVRGRAPKTDYSRDEFGSGWATIGDCDMRNVMLARSMTELELAEDGCIVLSGKLFDPYTAKTLDFLRGSTTSAEVQIDHVVALSDAWQKGAQRMDFTQRVVFANDPLNLLAVDGPTNLEKGDADAASWLPPNRSFRCRYIARQIAVKAAYELWVTEAEKAAMKRVLNGCGEQRVPVVSY